MSVYNRAEYLAASIDSVLSQTYPNFEFLIADDGSTDPGVRPLLKHYEELDPRIRVYYHENRGFAQELNYLMGVARGHFIANHDSDDISLPDRLER